MSDRESIMRRVFTVLTVLGVMIGLFVLGVGCGGAGGGGGGGLPDLPEVLGSVGGGVQGGTLTVTALDRHSGSAVIGANVYVAYGISAFHLPTTSTGTAVFPGLSPGPVTVTIIAANYSPVTIVNINAAVLTIPMDLVGIPTQINSNITFDGMTPSFIDGKAVLAWSNMGGGLAYSVIDDGSGNAVTDSNPIVIGLMEDLPVAIFGFVFDPLDDPDNIMQAYVEYPGGPPFSSITLNLASASMKQVSGTVTAPASFDLTDPDVEVNVLALAHLKALGNLLAGEVVSPIATISTTAVFGTPTGDDMRVARIPRDGEYFYAALLRDDETVVDPIKGSAYVIRGTYDSLGTTVNFDDFKASATSVNVSTGDLTPTISWKNTDAPGSSGGYFLVVLGDQVTPGFDWVLIADGDTTAVTIPDYVGYALASSTDYDAFVTAIYIPSFDFNSFTYADVEASYTHQTNIEYNFTTP